VVETYDPSLHHTHYITPLHKYGGSPPTPHNRSGGNNEGLGRFHHTVVGRDAVMVISLVAIKKNKKACDELL
jgi:hypothetical protein